MIPVKLELHNFLAYRDPAPLDLSGLHLACLAGANGAGKSSLLDAMTWALWGRARARRDDDLIHADEIDMFVRLTFVLGGHTYRVTRHRSRQGRGSSALHLEVLEADDWEPITAPTIRETQEKINVILRLDYETFINSAFLMQGRADEFTRKTPAERKNILGEILGLERWAIYEERAKARLRVIEAERERVEAEIERIDEELGREAEYLRELAEAQRALAELDEQVDGAEARVHELEDVQRDRDRLASQSQEIAQRIGQLDEELARLAGEGDEHQQQLRHYQDMLARHEEIEEGYASLSALRRQEQEMAARLVEHSSLRVQYGEFQQVIVAERSRLEAEQQMLARRREELTQRIREAEERLAAFQEAQQRLERLEALRAEAENLKAQREALKQDRAHLEGANRALKGEMEAAKVQQETIRAASEPVCPLCGQDLSETRRQELIEKLQREGSLKGDQYRTNLNDIEMLNSNISALTRQINDVELELRALPPLQQHVSGMSEQHKQTLADYQELEQAEARLEELQGILAQQDYAHNAQAELSAIQAQLGRLGYDEQGWQEARQRIDELEGFEGLKVELEHARRAAPEIQKTLKHLDERAARLQAQMDEDLGRLAEIRVAVDALDQRLADRQNAERALADLRDRERQAHYRVGAAEQKLHTLGQQRDRRQMLTEQADQIGHERGIYEELRTACGKDGIPAMIIEAAIPEIEEEANDILARMTDGRMHVRFDTQREKVTGGVKETLDIKISDELGTRDYETFSGGEAFRVNFAVRLALSRLLARRAGAQLRTLIVDEGFGTQDNSGRERLVQAINAIKDDFDLVLVITHIDELKEAFPVRIEVTKTREGSLVNVM